MSQLTDHATLPVRHSHAMDGDIRLSHYDAEHARALAPELAHLDEIAGLGTDLAWLDEAAARPGFDLVTASDHGMLVGYVVAEMGEPVSLTRLCLAPQAVKAHPRLAVILADAVLAHADRPWVDLRVPEAFPGLPALLDEGWVADDSAASDGDVRLTSR